MQSYRQRYGLLHTQVSHYILLHRSNINITLQRSLQLKRYAISFCGNWVDAECKRMCTAFDNLRPSQAGYSFTDFDLIHHHYYVPSVVNRSAVMDLHRSWSCATLIQSLYDIFVHSFMLSVHIVLGLPRPLLPFILPSISNRCTPSPLIICPKYWHFLILIVFNNDLLVFIYLV